jgi:hypothetical protein
VSQPHHRNVPTEAILSDEDDDDEKDLNRLHLVAASEIDSKPSSSTKSENVRIEPFQVDYGEEHENDEDLMIGVSTHSTSSLL